MWTFTKLTFTLLAVGLVAFVDVTMKDISSFATEHVAESRHDESVAPQTTDTDSIHDLPSVDLYRRDLSGIHVPDQPQSLMERTLRNLGYDQPRYPTYPRPTYPKYPSKPAPTPKYGKSPPAPKPNSAPYPKHAPVRAPVPY